MNYIIFDLEWNNAYSYAKKGFMNEIIEIGALKLNEKLDESKLEIAKNLLKINISPEQIAMATGLSLEQVTSLKSDKN